MAVTRRQLAAGLAAGVSLGASGLVDTSRAQAARARPTADRPLKVQIVLFDGFEVLDALGPFDALSIASKVGAALQTTLVSVEGKAQISALDGVIVHTTAPYDPDADVLIVPGAPQLWRAGQTPAGLDAAMQWFIGGRRILASVCTGGVWLARAGLLTGRNATTHHNAFDTIAQLGANVIRARVVDDGDLISSGGVTSGIDLALYLVERFFGSQVAFDTEQIIEYERRGVVWRTDERR